MSALGLAIGRWRPGSFVRLRLVSTGQPMPENVVPVAEQVVFSSPQG